MEGSRRQDCRHGEGLHAGGRPVAGALILGLALACLSHPAMAQTTAPATTPALAKMRVAAQSLVSNAGIFIAVARGYFRDQGIEVETTDFASPENSILAVASGTVDIGVAGLTAGFYNIAAKGGLRIVAAAPQEKAGYHNVGYVASKAAYDSGLKSVRDLPGRRLSITTLGGPAHYDTALIARKYGFDIDRISIVPLQTSANEVAALKGGQVEVLAASSPVPTQLAAQGFGHIVGWAGDEAPSQAGVLLVRPALIAQDHDLIQKFVTAYAHACADYNAAFNQLDSAGAPVKGRDYDELAQILATRLKITPAQVTQSLPYIDPQARLAVYDIHDQIAFWKTHGALDPKADLSQVVDDSFVKGNFTQPN